MNIYSFYESPSESCKTICTNDFNVYLDMTLLCSHVYSILISYTINGKHLNMYDNNGKRINSHLLSDNVIKLSYYQSHDNLYFN